MASGKNEEHITKHICTIILSGSDDRRYIRRQDTRRGGQDCESADEKEPAQGNEARLWLCDIFCRAVAVALFVCFHYLGAQADLNRRQEKLKVCGQRSPA